MNASLPLLLAALVGQAAELPNLDFSAGDLTHWKGEGFSLSPGPDRTFTVTSADQEGGRKALLYRTFVVPPGAGTLHVHAFASVGDDNLNLYLEAAEREIVPKSVRTPTGFEKAPRLLPADKGRPREYVWSIADRVGDTLRILVVDNTALPGRHVVCGGFSIEPVDQFETREFVRYMTGLVQRHKLPPLADAFRSKHFLVVGNADEKFIQGQIERCELMHQMFLNHFRVKGFKLRTPATRLMVAVFSSPEGFEAYIGRPVPSGVTGTYHPASNRLVVYDYGRNRALVDGKKRAEDQVKNLTGLDRVHILGRLDREAGEIRTETNVATIMHEAAHQMSFSTGLLNRDGDLPVWLVEGIATYCEPTEAGFWKGIGEKNPERLRTLRQAVTTRQELLPVRSLLESDQWLHGPGGLERAALGYAQSWALTRMLMEEQPRALKRYVEMIYSRRTPEHRLADFAEGFRGDLKKLEARHREYVQRLVQTVP